MNDGASLGIPRPVFVRAVVGALMLVAGPLWTIWAAADPAIPANKRIPAKIVGRLVGPSDQAMHMPTDVTVDEAGRCFVADGSNDRVVVFTTEGKFSFAITKPGAKQLSRPVALTFGPGHRLWIADTGHHRLVIVTGKGQLIQSIDLPKPSGGPWPDPTGIAVTADGKRTYVVDNDNHRLLLRDNASGHWTSFGKRGSLLGQFQWPFMICMGRKNEVYVTEVIGARVQRIRPGDRSMGSIGGWGVQLAQLYRPKGIAADGSGRLYVSDSTFGVIQVFSPTGTVEGVLTDNRGRLLRFAHPMGMCFGPAGRLYVVELGADRVAVVSIRPHSVSRRPRGRPALGEDTR